MNAENRVVALNIQAEAFDAKGKPAEKPKPAEVNTSPQSSERKGLFRRMFDKLKSEPTKPTETTSNEPKSVLETIEVMELSDKASNIGRKLSDIITNDTGGYKVSLGQRRNEYYSREKDSETINLRTINTNRKNRSGENTPPIAETPPGLTEVFGRINTIMGNPDIGNNITSIKMNGSSKIFITSESGVSLGLTLPRDGGWNGKIDTFGIRIVANMQSEEVSEEQKTALATLQEEFADKSRMIDTSDEVLTFIDGVIQKLPEENTIRTTERAQEKVAAEKAKAQKLAAEYYAKTSERRLSPEQQTQLAELQARHPDNPLFKQPWGPEMITDGKVEVFLTVPEDELDTVAENGATAEHSPYIDRLNNHMDAVMPADVKSRFPGLTRTDAMIAYPTTEPVPSYVKKKMIHIGVRVDPSHIFVGDSTELAEANARLDMSADRTPTTPPTPNTWSDGYWRKGMTFADSQTRFYPGKAATPHFLIYGLKSIAPEDIRIDSVAENEH